MIALALLVAASPSTSTATPAPVEPPCPRGFACALGIAAQAPPGMHAARALEGAWATANPELKAAAQGALDAAAKTGGEVFLSDDPEVTRLVFIDLELDANDGPRPMQRCIEVAPGTRNRPEVVDTPLGPGCLVRASARGVVELHTLFVETPDHAGVLTVAGVGETGLVAAPFTALVRSLAWRPLSAPLPARKRPAAQPLPDDVVAALHAGKEAHVITHVEDVPDGVMAAIHHATGIKQWSLFGEGIGDADARLWHGFRGEGGKAWRLRWADVVDDELTVVALEGGGFAQRCDLVVLRHTGSKWVPVWRAWTYDTPPNARVLPALVARGRVYGWPS